MRTLAEMIDELPRGLTVRQIVERTGRPEPSVRSMLWRKLHRDRYLATKRNWYRRQAARAASIPARDWSKADDALLEQLWPTTSAAQIGARLKRSRSAVIGRLHRLGLSKGGAA